ncbi:MAG: ribosome assembly factor SBDS [Candidatus Aenigmatarchaeota archaeon]
MISLEKAIIARLIKSGEKFEILVDPEKAMELRSGKEFPLEELIASEEIFEDTRKGTRASNEKINKAFGTNDLNIIVRKIIKEGEVQITTEQRKQMLDEKTKAIANLISKRGINPQTGLPHPPERILRAMEQAKVRVDLEKRIEEQIETILEAIQKIIPIKLEKIQIAIKIPPEFSGKASNIIRNFGNLIKDEWTSDGSYICLLEIPAGIQPEVYERLNNLTHGQVEVKVIKKV